MADLTCGSGGSSGAEIVAQINSNTNTIADHETRITDLETTTTDLDGRVTTNTTDISDHETRISSNETAVTNLNTTVGDHESRITTNETNITNLQTDVTALEAEDPLAVMHLVNNMQVTLTDDSTPTVLPVFDAVVIERGAFNADVTNNTLSTSVGVSACVVSIGMNVEFSGQEIFEIQVYINGQPYSNADFYLKGDGTDKPVSMYWQSIVPLNAGDVLDLRGRNAASGSVTITFVRTHFSIRSTVKEIV